MIHENVRKYDSFAAEAPRLAGFCGRNGYHYISRPVRSREVQEMFWSFLFLLKCRGQILPVKLAPCLHPRACRPSGGSGLGHGTAGHRSHSSYAK